MNWYYALTPVIAVAVCLVVLVGVGCVWVWVEARRDAARWATVFERPHRLRQLEREANESTP